jgi:hypothetical protein
MLKIKRKDDKLSIHDILLSELCELEESFRSYVTLIMDNIVIAKSSNKFIYRNNF